MAELGRFFGGMVGGHKVGKRSCQKALVLKQTTQSSNADWRLH